MELPSTPPPPPLQLPLTPDQIKRIELNRLKAKARQRQRQGEATTGSSANELNVNNKRPLQVVPATSTSPTVPKPLRKDTKLIGKYFEYDLSKMTNSKGGFLVDDNGDKEVDEEMRRREKLRESQRIAKNAEPPVFLDPALNFRCTECRSIDIDHTFKNVFHCLVCNKCKNDHPEKYSLLTKTECKTDYLLTDPELRDEDELPHMLKANPHKSTWNNMMLYLRCQVEAFATKKWGSLEALDVEFDRRETEKKKKRNEKFEEGLKDLRRRTREGEWQKRRDAEHRHTFTAGDGVQICTECGFEIEVEEF